MFVRIQDDLKRFLILYFAISSCTSIHLCMFLSLLCETLCDTVQMHSLFFFLLRKELAFYYCCYCCFQFSGILTNPVEYSIWLLFLFNLNIDDTKPENCSIGMRDYLRLNNNIIFCFITREFYSKSQSCAGTWSSKNKLPWWLGHAVWYVSIFFYAVSFPTV